MIIRIKMENILSIIILISCFISLCCLIDIPDIDIVDPKDFGPQIVINFFENM